LGSGGKRGRLVRSEGKWGREKRQTFLLWAGRDAINNGRGGRRRMEEGTHPLVVDVRDEIGHSCDEREEEEAVKEL
jgi:hypothetical protein